MDEALRRIRSFSAVTWTVGSIIVMLLAMVTIPPIFSNPRTGEVLVNPGAGAADEDRAWLADHPQELTVDNGVLHGTRRGGYLRLPGGSELKLITPRADVEATGGVSVFQQVGTQRDVDAEDWDYPRFIGILWGPPTSTLVMPSDRDGLLWFGASDSDWTADVTIPATRTIETSASGTGNAVLIYDGAALSGRFQHTGSGLLQVSFVGVGEWKSLVNDVDEVDLRASWEPSDRIAFYVEADTGAGTWTITLDTPAGDAPASPAVTTTPSTSDPPPQESR